MLSAIKDQLLKIVNDIDNGNSNITEDEEEKLIHLLSSINDHKISKYQACQYLNMSRATFDNLVREGKLPQGTRQVGFKEKFWRKGDIMKYITRKNS
jgi:predicted DNA-binding transcriptional regulator AlpA